MRRERRGALVVRRDVTLFDAGALDDPLIGRVEHFLEIGVADNPLWKIRPQADDDGAENGVCVGSKISVLSQIR